jgi:hypothetical protein
MFGLKLCGRSREVRKDIAIFSAHPDSLAVGLSQVAFCHTRLFKFVMSSGAETLENILAKELQHRCSIPNAITA